MEEKPLLKLVVIGPNNSGKTTLITKYVNDKFESQYFPTKNCALQLLNLQQREKKFTPLAQSTLEDAKTTLIKSRKLISIISNKIPLSFAVEIWDIPCSFLLPVTASSLKLIKDAHGCIITIDSTNKENAIPIIGSFANLLNEAWGSLDVNPTSLFVTKSDLYSPTMRRRDIHNFCNKLLIRHFDITLTNGLTVKEKIHELIDRVLISELDRISSNTCKINWKFCKKLENNNQNNNNLSSPIAIANQNRNNSSVNRSSNSSLLATSSMRNMQLSEQTFEPIGAAQYEDYVDEEEEEDDDLFFEEEEEMVEESQEEEIILQDKKVNNDRRHDINSTFRSLSRFYEQLQMEIEITLRDNLKSLSRTQRSKYNNLLCSCKEEYEQIKHYLNVYKISSEESSSDAGSGSSYPFQVADDIAVKFIQKKEKIENYLHSLMLAESIDQIDNSQEIPDIESIYIQSPAKHSSFIFSPVRNSPMRNSPIRNM